MQKVVGSSPIIRSSESPAQAGLSAARALAKGLLASHRRSPIRPQSQAPHAGRWRRRHCQERGDDPWPALRSCKACCRQQASCQDEIPRKMGSLSVLGDG